MINFDPEDKASKLPHNTGTNTHLQDQKKKKKNLGINMQHC
jgi:hypothetical protein